MHEQLWNCIPKLGPAALGVFLITLGIISAVLYLIRKPIPPKIPYLPPSKLVLYIDPLAELNSEIVYKIVIGLLKRKTADDIDEALDLAHAEIQKIIPTILRKDVANLYGSQRAKRYLAGIPFGC